MIVRCERCETRFTLDESRLPARGARVRCSRCKHAFFVAPPGATRDELVHQVAGESAASERTRPPEAAWDLEDGSAAPAGTAPGSTEAAPPRRELGDDNEWRFEDEAPRPGAKSDRATRPPSAPRAAAPPTPTLAELGDPESWDLLASMRRRAAIPVPEAAATLESPAPAGPAHEPVEETVAAEEPVAEHAAPDALAEAARTRRSPASAVGWIGMISLSALVLWAAFRPPAEIGAAFAPVGGFEVVEARARLVENLYGGSVLVVSGRLRNPGPAARALGAPLEVVLLDGDGSPVDGARALAGPALGTARVREEDPEQLGAAQARTAAALGARTFGPRAEVAFDAVFPDPPVGAKRFALATAPAAAR